MQHLVCVTAITYKAVSSIHSSSGASSCAKGTRHCCCTMGLVKAGLYGLQNSHRCNSNHIQGCFQLGFHSSSGTSSCAKGTRHCCCTMELVKAGLYGLQCLTCVTAITYKAVSSSKCRAAVVQAVVQSVLGIVAVQWGCSKQGCMDCKTSLV